MATFFIDNKEKKIVRKKNPSENLKKIYQKVDKYNKTADKFGFPHIEYDHTTLLLTPFRAKEINDRSFFSSIKGIFIYAYMGWRWDKVQSYKNKNL